MISSQSLTGAADAGNAMSDIHHGLTWFPGLDSGSKYTLLSGKANISQKLLFTLFFDWPHMHTLDAKDISHIHSE